MQVFCFGKMNLLIFVSKILAIRTTVRMYLRGNWHSQGGVRRYNNFFHISKFCASKQSLFV